ncbi:TPA: AAA family ATPase [Streptococcus pneumoniae]|nr:AAA family ATPase [Streptococcus pneumoniae]HEX1693492.1 AAA family ATPase [Streptococcus pneumoniae]
MKGKEYENRTVSFATSSSGVTLITGKNGTGKSTLL